MKHDILLTFLFVFVAVSRRCAFQSEIEMHLWRQNEQLCPMKGKYVSGFDVKSITEDLRLWMSGSEVLGDTCAFFIKKISASNSSGSDWINPTGKNKWNGLFCMHELTRRSWLASVILNDRGKRVMNFLPRREHCQFLYVAVWGLLLKHHDKQHHKENYSILSEQSELTIWQHLILNAFNL